MWTALLSFWVPPLVSLHMTLAGKPSYSEQPLSQTYTLEENTNRPFGGACLFGGVPCAVHALCEKLAVLHHREFGKFRKDVIEWLLQWTGL